MQEVVLKEKVDLNEKASFFCNGAATAGDYMEMKISRNAGDDTFNLNASQNGNRFDKVDFNVNNKSFPASFQPAGNIYKIHSAVMGSPEFSKSKAISSYFSLTRNENYGSISIFPTISPIDKNIVLKPNTYLHLETLNSATITVMTRDTTAPMPAYENDIKVYKYYTNTYIVPRLFDPINGNKTLFDIYVDNDDAEEVTGDVSFNPGQVTTSATGATKMELNTMPVQGDDVNEMSGVTKVSTIDVFDYTYYDYDKKKISIGFDDDSIKGLRIPYDFSGNYKWISKISPNIPFKDMSIMQSKEIESPMLDPYEGKVRLNIEDTIEEDHDWRIISADSFERLQDIDPSIKGLERISYEENI